MSKIVVTGCAGFIGSAICRRLLDDGEQVVGIDCFTDNYASDIKKRNLQGLMEKAHFTFLHQDILTMNWPELMKDAQYLFHQAAVPGVRSSWGKSFAGYVTNNIMATQLILEAAKGTDLKKLIYASSSSVYGVTSGSTSESILPAPVSPYGVSKLAGEHLCQLYAKNYGVPAISLRYFTVYGPGQRPDMAFHKFIKAVLDDKPVEVFGDGMQTRDFTFIDDAVEANIKAMRSQETGEVFNIGGRSRIVLMDVISLIGQLLGRKPSVLHLPPQAGDPPHTWADIGKAKRLLGYDPKTPLEDGLRLEMDYVRKLYS